MNSDHKNRFRVLVDGCPVPEMTPPPGRKIDYWPVINLGVDQRKFAILGPRWWAWWTHYVDRRTVPCLLDLGRDCRSCVLAERRWSAYLPVAVPDRAGVHLVHLTAHAVNSCPELADEGFDLFGRGLLLRRQPRSKLGKVVAAIHPGEREIPRIHLVTPARVAAQVFALWGTPFTLESEGDK